MATEKLLTTATSSTIGFLYNDIGRVVDSILGMVQTVTSNKEKCQNLANSVKHYSDTVSCILKDMQQNGSGSAFTEEKYEVTLQAFLTVIRECEDYVQTFKGKRSWSQMFFALQHEEGFSSLNSRLERAVASLNTAQQSNQTVALHDMNKRMTQVENFLHQNSRLKEAVESSGAVLFKDLNERQNVFKAEVKALEEGRMHPDDSTLLNVCVGESLDADYILAGQLDDGTDVILVHADQADKEASILRMLSDAHSSILKFYGTFSKTSSEKYLVFERPGRNLYTLYDWERDDLVNNNCKIRNLDKNNWALKKRIARGIAAGLNSAHNADILHRNLRSANIFLTDEGNPKIFGFFKGRVKSTPSDKKWTGIEQLRWTAPEMLNRSTRPEYNEKADIFSLGVIIWELITHEPPFSEFVSLKDLMRRRIDDKITLNFSQHESQIPFLVEFQQISLDCMHDNPEQRPAIDAVLRRLTLLAPEEMYGAHGGGPV